MSSKDELVEKVARKILALRGAVMSIGAELPPQPVQCPMCRRWFGESELGEAIASADGEPSQTITVCRECRRGIERRGEVVAMMNHRLWVVGLPEERPIAGR